MHVKNLTDRLRAAGCRVVVLDMDGGTGKDAEQPYRSIANPRLLSVAVGKAVAEFGLDLINLHVFGAEWKILLPQLAVRQVLGVPIVVTVHSLRHVDLPPRDRQLFATALRHLDHFLCAGPHVRDNLVNLGAPPQRVTAFVPHVHAADDQALEDVALPAEVAQFIAAHAPVVASGTGVLAAIEGRDLYGLDLFVRAANIVRRHHKNAGFVFVAAGYADQRLLEDAADYIQQADLAGNVLIYRRPICPGSALWRAGDVFVRATLFDGDAISLREALESGVPCVASDAVARPAGCRLHRTGDPLDLARAILETLAEPKPAQRPFAKAEDGFATICGVFQRVLDAEPRPTVAHRAAVWPVRWFGAAVERLAG